MSDIDKPFWGVMNCPHCQKPMVEEVLLEDCLPMLIPMNKCTLIQKPNQAPKVICQCGKTVVLLKGGSV